MGPCKRHRCGKAAFNQCMRHLRPVVPLPCHPSSCVGRTVLRCALDKVRDEGVSPLVLAPVAIPRSGEPCVRLPISSAIEHLRPVIAIPLSFRSAGMGRTAHRPLRSNGAKRPIECFAIVYWRMRGPSNPSGPPLEVFR